MPINPYVNQYNRQLDAIRRREAKLFRVRAPRNAPGGSLMAKIEERIPEKLRGTLDTAFYTAFQVLFQQGTGLLKKTIPEKKLRGSGISGNTSSRRTPAPSTSAPFIRAAAGAERRPPLRPPWEAAPWACWGWGCPIFPHLMIPAFSVRCIRLPCAMVSPTTPGGALLHSLPAVRRPSQGAERKDYSDRPTDSGGPSTTGSGRPLTWDAQMRETSRALADAMLVVKFIQGTAVVGVVGGACNFSASRRVTEVANLKYQKRFLEKKRRGL